MKAGWIVGIAAFGLAGCATVPPPTVADAPEPLCESRSVSLFTDFAGAPAMKCAILGEHSFALLVTPEHAPPINPSPWFAFRYETGDAAPLDVRIDYLGGKHRYAPILDNGQGLRAAQAVIAQDRASVQLTLPAGAGTVSSQELVVPQDAEGLVGEIVATADGEDFVIGSSLDGRPIHAARMGDADAPRLIVLLGRAHPPEVTGALAMDAFLKTLAEHFARDPALRARYQVLAVPMINPDGVFHGHWRAGRGGVDLNRDWGEFSQPETRAVGDWLASLLPGVRPVVMIDFHSTRENLFYVQGEAEATQPQSAFRERWLGSKLKQFADYPFKLEPRNANPGSGTSKNWFHREYAIPAYTYEVADDADRAALRGVARELAADLLPALEETLP